MPQPVQEFGEAPLGGVDPAAPVDGFELPPVRGGGDLLGFAPGAVIAPEIVVVERLEIFTDRDNARAGGIDRERANLVATDTA